MSLIKSGRMNIEYSLETKKNNYNTHNKIPNKEKIYDDSGFNTRNTMPKSSSTYNDTVSDFNKVETNKKDELPNSATYHPSNNRPCVNPKLSFKPKKITLNGLI